MDFAINVDTEILYAIIGLLGLHLILRAWRKQP